MASCGSEGKLARRGDRRIQARLRPPFRGRRCRASQGSSTCFRELGRPVIFTRSHLADTAYVGKATKSKRVTNTIPEGFNDFPNAIAPKQGEWILEKTKAAPSSRRRSPPISCSGRSINRRRDAAFDLGAACAPRWWTPSRTASTHFRVDDCCFDRSNFAHCANLFDMNAKYATVVSLDDVEGKMLGPQMKTAGARPA